MAVFSLSSWKAKAGKVTARWEVICESVPWSGHKFYVFCEALAIACALSWIFSLWGYLPLVFTLLTAAVIRDLVLACTACISCHDASDRRHLRREGLVTPTKAGQAETHDQASWQHFQEHFEAGRHPCYSLQTPSPVITTHDLGKDSCLTLVQSKWQGFYKEAVKGQRK